ncbi:hypothetical protein [Micromonospora sp. WMMD714]|uniref:DUF7003 family protein n=1 Tax=Micromonospora sp. WMMD714 TaxID=3016097 RepID=UPI00249A9832|nr:hypothetical protein [Micromonospora sp. WMMD714]WFE65951.1 hypothetical protein O7625_22890 [Micromonospora sp. WMMD714]
MDTVGWDPRAGNVVDLLHALGNCLTGTNETWARKFAPRIDNIAALFEGGPLASRYRQVPPVVRGRAVPVVAAATTPPEDLFRLLAPRHRDLLLAEDVEVRRLVPADLPQVLRLDDWHHPPLRVRPPNPGRERRRQLHEVLTRHAPPQERVPFEVRPSDTETYQQIGAVLASADPARYRPTRPGNTHWSNWPMSGAL